MEISNRVSVVVFSISALLWFFFPVHVCIAFHLCLTMMSQYNGSISLWTTVANKTRPKKTAGSKLLHHIIIITHTQTHAHCTNVSIFNIIFPISIYIFFFIYEIKKNCSVGFMPILSSYGQNQIVCTNFLHYL